MKLSIIIPVYNVEGYLRQCLDSIYSQDLNDCEVILVNDGSTDGSPSILDEYVSHYSRITTLVSKRNGGLSSARNAGFAKAKGEFVYYVDSDDYLTAGAVSTILSVVNANRSDFYYLDCVVTNRGKRLIHFPFACREDGRSTSLFDRLYESGVSILPNSFSYVYSRLFLLQYNLTYCEGLTHEDALFKYQCFLTDGSVSAIHVQEPFYVYRVGREGSICTNKSLRNFTDQQYIRREVHRLLGQRGISCPSFYQNMFQEVVSCFLEASDCKILDKHNRFFNGEDKRIMKKGISTQFEYRLWVLACIHPALTVRFIKNGFPPFIRRFLNVSTSLMLRFVR